MPEKDPPPSPEHRRADGEPLHPYDRAAATTTGAELTDAILQQLGPGAAAGAHRTLTMADLGHPNLGAELLALRLTQGELANRAGVHALTVRRGVRGDRLVKMKAYSIAATVERAWAAQGEPRPAVAAGRSARSRRTARWADANELLTDGS